MDPSSSPSTPIAHRPQTWLLSPWIPFGLDFSRASLQQCVSRAAALPGFLGKEKEVVKEKDCESNPVLVNDCHLLEPAPGPWRDSPARH